MVRKHDELAGLGLGIGMAAAMSALKGSLKCTRCKHAFKPKVINRECSTCSQRIFGEPDKNDALCWKCSRRQVYFEPEDNWGPRLCE